MDPFAHLDLLSVGVAVAGTTLLGFVILFSDWRSATSRAFFYFALVTAAWSVANYSYYQVSAGTLALWLIRLVIFFGAWHAFTFFNLATAFPAREVKRGWWFRFLLLPYVAIVSILTLSPLSFERITSVTATGSIGGLANGPVMPLFGLTVLALVIAGIGMLSWRTVRAGRGQRASYSLVLVGLLITFVLLMTFNLILPAAFANPKYIPLGALFLLPFVVSSSLAILRYRLFNVRIAAIGVLSFFLSTALFTEVIFAGSLIRLLFTASEFVLVLIFSYWLIQSVEREVEQREHIEQLAGELQKANEQQVILIHFITHQIKGFVTKSRNIFAALLEGDYGTLPETLKPLVDEGFRSDTQGATTIQQILDASNVKSGKVKYTMAPLDLKALIEKIIAGLKPAADAKHLELTFTTEGDTTIQGDSLQLENALKNLIDNSIRYTPSGSVAVSLTHVAGDGAQGAKVRFQVKDTGVGITPEDMAKLFTEGGHGAESTKVNVDSTGYGLYIVKNIIEAHGGKVWAESEGAGKGSTFIAELPV